MYNKIFSYAFRCLTALGRQQSANVTIADLAERNKDEEEELEPELSVLEAEEIIGL